MDFSWREGYFLEELLDRREEVRERRIRDIVQIIDQAYQKTIFGDSGETMLAMTSCGLLCGK